MDKKIAQKGEKKFFFLLLGHKCEKLINANIYIKVYSKEEIFLSKKNNLKNLLFPCYGDELHCNPSGYFYGKAEEGMSFNASKRHSELISIEVKCDCKELKRIIIWLKDENFYGIIKMREYLEEAEATY